MVDTANEVVIASINREIELELKDLGDDELVSGCPIYEFIDNEYLRRLAALNIVMARIINSVELN